MEVNIQSKIKFFADVTLLFSVVRHPAISASELNDDLQLVNNWAYQWKLSFNPEPNKHAVEVVFQKEQMYGSSPNLNQWNRGYQS